MERGGVTKRGGVLLPRDGVLPRDTASAYKEGSPHLGRHDAAARDELVERRHHHVEADHAALHARLREFERVREEVGEHLRARRGAAAAHRTVVTPSEWRRRPILMRQPHRPLFARLHEVEPAREHEVAHRVDRAVDPRLAAVGQHGDDQSRFFLLRRSQGRQQQHSLRDGSV